MIKPMTGDDEENDLPSLLRRISPGIKGALKRWTIVIRWRLRRFHKEMGYSKSRRKMFLILFFISLLFVQFVDSQAAQEEMAKMSVTERINDQKAVREAQEGSKEYSLWFSVKANPFMTNPMAQIAAFVISIPFLSYRLGNSILSDIELQDGQTTYFLFVPLIYLLCIVQAGRWMLVAVEMFMIMCAAFAYSSDKDSET
ncbi:MAG: hypothetical protein PUD15_08570 [Prevotella sp.]|nr:hypothetical protein [Prevotella sp.]